MKHKSPLILVLLLALMPVWPTHAVDLGELRDSKGLPTPFGRQVLEDFHGKDLKGKDGPLRKLGMDLIVTSHKFKEYQARGGRRHTGRPFKSDNPLLRINQERIVIDAVAAGDVEMLKQKLVELGLEQSAVFDNTVSGTLPIDALDQAAALASLQQARPSMMQTRTGSVTSQGDASMNAATARTAFGVDGSGVIVGTTI